MKMGKEKIRIVDKEEHVDKGEEIYGKIKEELEPEHKGEFVAIEVDTGDYFVGKDPIEADEKAREKYPDAVFFLARIGYRAAFVRR
jgi:hypothetical protein